MPCNGGPCESTEEIFNKRNRAITEKLEFLKASLCASLNYLKNTKQLDEFFSLIDEEESGIKVTELKKWWTSHQKEDESRRKREKQSLIDKQKKLQKELKEIELKIKNKK